jgi:hypothetical protein
VHELRKLDDIDGVRAEQNDAFQLGMQFVHDPQEAAFLAVDRGDRDGRIFAEAQPLRHGLAPTLRTLTVESQPLHGQTPRLGPL